MTKFRLLLLGALAGSLPLSALPADAAPAKKKPAAHEASGGPAKLLGKEGVWAAYMSRDKTGRVCYLFAHPQKSEAKVKRKAPVAMITHRPEENIANVVSFMEGYALKDGSEVVLDVDGTKYEMFTKDDSAWARTAELDKNIVTAFIKGKRAVVKGTPQKGAPTTDTYSLAGFTKALGLIDKACDVKR